MRKIHEELAFEIVSQLLLDGGVDIASVKNDVSNTHIFNVQLNPERLIRVTYCLQALARYHVIRIERLMNIAVHYQRDIQFAIQHDREYGGHQEGALTCALMHVSVIVGCLKSLLPSNFTDISQQEESPLRHFVTKATDVPPGLDSDQRVHP